MIDIKTKPLNLTYNFSKKAKDLIKKLLVKNVNLIPLIKN